MKYSQSSNLGSISARGKKNSMLSEFSSSELQQLIVSSLYLNDLLLTYSHSLIASDFFPFLSASKDPVLGQLAKLTQEHLRIIAINGLLYDVLFDAIQKILAIEQKERISKSEIVVLKAMLKK